MTKRKRGARKPRGMGQGFARFEVVDATKHVEVDAYCYVTPYYARKLAAWLIRAAEYLEARNGTP